MSKTTINDQEYYDELCKELELKQAKATFLLQEIQLLSSLKRDVESGMTRNEIKKMLEHNPFDDFGFLGTKARGLKK